MEFLKEILGDDFYSQLSEKINAYNGDEKNQQKIKLGNLGSGEYVSKGKYETLEQTLNGKNTELETANNLIAELKKGTKGNENLQDKITGYETQVQQLQKQIADIKLKSAIKVALLSENASDVDYLTFKLESKLKDENKALELDENDNIKGWKELCTDLKTQFPMQFSTSTTKKVDPNKLPDGGTNEISKEEFNKMGYNDRLKLYNENPEQYQKLTQQ